MKDNKKIRVAINGFGRIGRAAFKIGFEKAEIEFVAINDPGGSQVAASLLQYDTVYRRYARKVEFDEKSIIVDGQAIPVLSEKDPGLLPWRKMNVDVVIESTGRFTKDGAAAAHIKAGAKRVVISAPAKGGNVKTYVFGANTDKYGQEQVISNA